MEARNDQETAKMYSSKPVVANIALFKERFLRTMIIDMKALVSVDYLLLCFEKSDMKTKMRIRVYDENKRLVSGNFYQDNTWMQLTKNPFTKEMKELFEDPIRSGLNCLGTKLNVTTRYLFVEISHTVLPIIGEVVEV